MLTQMILRPGNNQSSPGNAEKADDKREMHMAGTVQNSDDNNDRWVIDSGATAHFTFNAEILQGISKLKYPYSVKLPNGQKIIVKHYGNCVLSDDLILYDVLYVPEFTVNLISVSKMIKDNCLTLLFNETSCIIQGQSSRNILKTGEPEGGL